MLVRHNRISLIPLHTLRSGSVFKRQPNGPEYMVISYPTNDPFNAVDLHTGQIVQLPENDDVYYLPQAVLDTGDIVE